MKRGVPICLIKLLSDWYGKVFACVKWEACLSKLVQLVTGVRQGGVLSPVLFTCVSYAEARNRYRLDVSSVRPYDRLSVCPSVTRWYCIKTAEHIAMLSSPHDNPFILVLCVSRSSRNSNEVTPCGAAKQRWGLKMSQFSTNNLLYLRNG